jgi:CRP/FNR family transcriptional regulator, cyclic AMP receptor protein
MLHEVVDCNSSALPAFMMAMEEGRATEHSFRRGQALFVQGARADALFYIRHGKVKVTVLSEHGKEAVIAILEAGNFCGENCLVGQTLRTASTEAMTDCTALRIDRDAALQLIQNNAGFSDVVLRHLLARNMRIESDLIDQLFNSSEKRLARLLLILAGAGKEGATRSVEPPISQEMLAEMIGTTRSRVSHFMNKFRQLGFISYNGHSGQLEVHKTLSSVVVGD